MLNIFIIHNCHAGRHRFICSIASQTSSKCTHFNSTATGHDIVEPTTFYTLRSASRGNVKFLTKSCSLCNQTRLLVSQVSSVFVLLKLNFSWSWNKICRSEFDIISFLIESLQLYQTCFMRLGHRTGKSFLKFSEFR